VPIDYKAINNIRLATCKPSCESSCVPEYDFRILRSIRKMIRVVDIHSRKLYREYKITTPQLICLHSLQREGPITLSRLAEEVSLGLSTTNGIVDRLEVKGLLTRTRSQRDRRKVDLMITPIGRELTEATPDLLQEQFAEALGQLPEAEQAAIALSLERVVELMGGAHLASSPNLVSGANLNESAQTLNKELNS